MSWFKAIQIRFRALFRKRKLDAEMDEEMRTHIEMRTRENIEAGMNPEEARFCALRRFGWTESIKETCRDQRGVSWIENLLQDLRYGLRMLGKNLGFTAVVILVLALGIGANGLIFSVINVVLLMRFPYPDAERLVLVQTTNLKGDPGGVAPANFVEWRREARSFEYLSAKIDWSGYDLSGPEGQQQVIGVPVTADIFEMLGVTPQLGRRFEPGDDRPESAPVVILSHRLWTTRYNRDSGIVGRTIMLNARPYSVIGVMPPGFYLNREVTSPADEDQLWVPFASQFGLEGLSKRDTANYRVWGRLKPGVKIEQAQAEMNIINARLQQAYPDINAGQSVAVSPLSAFRADRLKRSGDVLMLLMGAVMFVLLIACANVANLQLARGAARRHELVIRSALGASRLHIIRQLMIEVLILALLGGAASLLVAWWAQQVLMTFLPENLPLPRLDRLTIDVRLVLFAFTAAILSGIVAGLVPAVQLSSREGMGGTNDVLKATGRGLTGDKRGRRLRNILVVSEVGLAVILLVGAGLLVRSLLLLQKTELGFDPTNVLTVRVPAPDRPPNFTPKQGKQRTRVIGAMLQRIQALPGVESTAMVNGLPTFSIVYPSGIILEQDPSTKATAIGRVVSADYFRVLRIPLKAGRFLSPSDTEGTPYVVLIDQTLAARYFPNTDPIGKRLRWQGADASNPFATIVGVVGAVHDTGIRDEISPEIYASYLQVDNYSIHTALVIRAQQAAAALATPVRREIAAVSPDQPIHQIQLMEQMLHSSVAAERFNARLFTGLAVLALILAAAGIYGVVSYSVVQRTREIGIRMALGAQHRDVLRLILVHGAKPTLVGVALGMAGALALTRLLTRLLYQIKPSDPLTFATVAIVLALVALAACWLPARRAIRLDPREALHYE